MSTDAFGKGDHISRDFIGGLSHVTSASVAPTLFARTESQTWLHGPGWHRGPFLF